MNRLILFYRKRYPTAFSIERLFDQLARKFIERGLTVDREELPLYNDSLGNVFKNMKWALSRVRGKDRSINHVTGDVTSVLFACPGPSVITIHDCNPLLRYPKTHPRYWFYRLVIYELAARRADAITVISEKTKTELLQLTFCPERKMTVIPNFVDPSFTYQPRPFNKAYPTILQIGVKENKNLSRLADALEGVPCKLVIVGKPSAADLSRLQEKSIDFTWEAGIDDGALRKRYAEADVLSFVSTYEGFGLPILEAQLTGRPVLTSDLSPHREVAGVGGAVLVDPLEAEDIRRGLLQIIQNDELRRDLITRGQRNADLYTIDAIADRYLALYKTLI